MKRVIIVLAGISLLLTSISIRLPFGRAHAMYSSSNIGGSSCNTKSYPAPYSGGASVAKFYYLSDGSTVTITSTGAVVKQSPCHTAYREGWINPADICNIQSAQDLNGGRLSTGNSNPYGTAGYHGCAAATQTTTKTPTPTTPTQTQTQSVTINNTQPAVKAATTTQASTPAAATKSLPNTGPGNILMLSGATTAVGTLGHWYYSRRGRR